MRRVVPRDPLLVGRIGALAGAGMWLFIGGQAIVPVAAIALAFLAATIVMVWWLDIKRGRAAPLQEMPMRIVVADLVTAGVWTIGTAPNPRSIAFVIIVAVGALAMYRLGRAGLRGRWTLGDGAYAPSSAAGSALRGLGARGAVGVRIFLTGQPGATSTPAGVDSRPCDAPDGRALEQLACHAAIALPTAWIT